MVEGLRAGVDVWPERRAERDGTGLALSSPKDESAADIREATRPKSGSVDHARISSSPLPSLSQALHFGTSRSISGNLLALVPWCTRSTFIESFDIALKTLFTAIAATTVVPLLLLWLNHTDDTDSWKVNTTAAESIVLHSQAYMPGKPIFTTLIESSFPRVIAVTWVPLLLVSLLEMQGRRRTLLPLFFFVYAIIYSYLLHGPWKLNLGGWFLTQMYYLGTLIFLKVFLPCDSAVWLLMFCMILTLGLSQMGVQILVSLAQSSEEILVLISVVVVPALRESMLMPLRFVLHIFMTNERYSGTGVRVPHTLCLILVLYPMIGTSVFGRLMTQSIKSPTLLAISILAQSIIEACLRLTMFQRDDFIWKSYNRVTRVHSLQSFRIGKLQHRQASFFFSSRVQETIEFTTIFVICEMVCEHVAILSTGFFLPMCWDIRYMFSFREYIAEDYLFGDFDLKWTVLATFLMLIAEVAVDTLAGMYEISRMKMPLVETWASIKPLGRAFLFLIPVIFGISSTLNAAFSTANFRYRSCHTANICYCHEDGSNIILKDYCRFLYPVTDGIPSGLQAYIVHGKITALDYPFEPIDEFWIRPHGSSLSFAGYFIDNGVDSFADFDVTAAVARAYEVSDSNGLSEGFHFSANQPGLAIFVFREGTAPKIAHVHGALCNATGEASDVDPAKHIPPVVILDAPTPELFVQAAMDLIPQDRRPSQLCEEGK